MIEYKFEYEKAWKCPNDLSALKGEIAEQHKEYIFPGMSITVLEDKIVVTLLSESEITDKDLKSINKLIYAFKDPVLETESILDSEIFIEPIIEKTIKFELNKEV